MKLTGLASQPPRQEPLRWMPKRRHCQSSQLPLPHARRRQRYRAVGTQVHKQQSMQSTGLVRLFRREQRLVDELYDQMLPRR